MLGSVGARPCRRSKRPLELGSAARTTFLPGLSANGDFVELDCNAMGSARSMHTLGRHIAITSGCWRWAAARHLASARLLKRTFEIDRERRSTSLACRMPHAACRPAMGQKNSV